MKNRGGDRSEKNRKSLCGQRSTHEEKGRGKEKKIEGFFTPNIFEQESGIGSGGASVQARGEGSGANTKMLSRPYPLGRTKKWSGMGAKRQSFCVNSAKTTARPRYSAAMAPQRASAGEEKVFMPLFLFDLICRKGSFRKKIAGFFLLVPLCIVNEEKKLFALGKKVKRSFKGLS